MMLLPMVSPYDDDCPVKRDASDSGHDQSFGYSMTGTSMESDQTRKVRDVKANFQQLRYIPITLVELPLQLL